MEVKRVSKTKKEPVETAPNLRDKIEDVNKEEFLQSISVDSSKPKKDIKSKPLTEDEGNVIEITLSDILKCFTIKVSTLKKLIKDKENRKK